MKALIYKGPGKKVWDEVPDPKIEQPTDVIVKMVATTICGTDLHILKGDVPEVAIDRILGHEGSASSPKWARGSPNSPLATESSWRASARVENARIAARAFTATVSILRAWRESAGSLAT